MNLAGLFTSTVTVASQTGAFDSYAKPTYASPRAIAARVEGQRKMLRGPNREEAQSNHRIYTDQVVLLTDRIWLPGANTANVSESKAPLAVASIPSRWGNQTLYEVDL